MTTDVNMQIGDRSTTRLGFTLVELLVVVAIIALLIAMLLPALSKAKAVAVRVNCAAQLRGVGLAIRMYVEDNQQWMPKKLHDHSNKLMNNGEMYGLGLLYATDNINTPDAGYIAKRSMLDCPGRQYVNGWPFNVPFFKPRFCGYSFCNPAALPGNNKYPNAVKIGDLRPQFWEYKAEVDYNCWVACFRDNGTNPVESPHENEGVNGVFRDGSVAYAVRPTEDGWPYHNLSKSESGNKISEAPLWRELSLLR